MKITVTGCDGFVGFHLAHALARGGHEVIAACQHNTALFENEKCIRAVQIDITRPETILACLNKTECIVHCAALLDIAGAKWKLHEVNVRGTANMLAAAKAQNVGRFIFFSTAEVYSTPQQMPVTEESRLNPGTEYGKSKLAAEKLVQGAQREWGLRTVILRPSLVYGPGCVYAGGAFTLLLILKEIGIRKLPIIRGNLRFNCVYVDDVVGFVEHLISHNNGWNSIFTLADNNIVDMEGFQQIIYRSLGFKSGFSIAYPKKMLMLLSQLGKHLPLLWWISPFIALVNAYWCKVCHRYHLQPVLRFPRVDSSILHFARIPGNFLFDNSRVQATGYRFMCPSFEQGLHAMLDWYKVERLIP